MLNFDIYFKDPATFPHQSIVEAYLHMPLSVSTNIFLRVFKEFTQTDNKERNIQLSVADIFKRFSSFMLHLLLQYTVTFLSILYTSGIFIVSNGRVGILY